MKAVKSVNLVEQEAHSADLTEKVQSMLGLTAVEKQELSGENQSPSESLATDQANEGEEQSEQVSNEDEAEEE